MSEIGVKIEKLIQLLVDNKSAINLANNNVSPGRSKLIKTIFHFLRNKSVMGSWSLFIALLRCNWLIS